MKIRKCANENTNTKNYKTNNYYISIKTKLKLNKYEQNKTAYAKN